MGRVSTKRPRVPEADRNRVLMLRGGKMTFKKIAQKLHYDPSTVRRIYLKFEKTGSIRDRPRSGRPRKLTDRERRALVFSFLKDRFISTSQASEYATESGLPQISQRSIQRYLKAYRMHSYMPSLVPKFTPAHCRARREFSRKYQSIGLENFRRFIYSDEAMFERLGHGKRQRVWDRRRKQLTDRRTVGVTKFGGGKIMVWAAISYFGLHGVVRIRGTMNSAAYLDLLKAQLDPILANHFGARQLHPARTRAIFIHDNASCHVANIVKNWLQVQQCGHIHIPPNSPDLNPIEHVWALFKNEVYSRKECANLEELWATIEIVAEEVRNSDEWLRKIRNLIDSMPARVLAVRKSKGKATRY
jgi:transposase